MPADEFAALTAALRESLRGFLSARSPLSAIREHVETPIAFDRAFWTLCATEMQLLGIGVPEELGGSGADRGHLVTVFSELGKSLACGPFLSTALATTVLTCVDDEKAKRDSLPDIVAGKTVATFAATMPQDAAKRSCLRAEPSASTWSVTGTVRFVTDAAAADLIVVAAETPTGPGIYLVEAAAAGVEVIPVTTLDLTRPLAHVRFRAAPARPVKARFPQAAVDLASDTAALLLAADAVGGTERVVEMSVDYAKTRTQFGRPIGSFQAVKHKCADLLLELELARSLLEVARHAYGEQEHRSVLASAAKAFCTDTYVGAAKDCIQIHGGIGFTWEHPAHVYLKRAKSSQLLMGSPRWHRDRVAELMNLPAA
jgi:alkylation response protein AidB-like acyl-CoA dehydrogenase